MKFDISWHQNCLKNRKIHLARLEQEIDRLIKRAGLDKTEVEFYERQIKCAMEDGRYSFDCDKYLKPRIRKY